MSTAPVTALIYYGQPVNFLGLSAGSGWVSSSAPTVKPASWYSNPTTCETGQTDPVPNSRSTTNLDYVENLIFYDSTGGVPVDANKNPLPVKYLDQVTIGDTNKNLWAQVTGPCCPSCTLPLIRAAAATEPKLQPLLFIIIPEYASTPGTPLNGAYASQASVLTSAVNSIYLGVSKSFVALGGSKELTLGSDKLAIEVFNAGSPPVVPPGPNNNNTGGGGSGGGGSSTGTPKYVWYIIGGVGALILLIIIFGAISNKKNSKTTKS